MSITENFLRAPGPIEISERMFGVFDRRWIGCIWELAPFGHERSSWVRHILEPDLPDPTGYINDTLPEGRTGGAR
jgi:hypothetical protein